MSDRINVMFVYLFLSVFFFFQAEDGIRDGRVTGVQTCALPIYISLLSLIPRYLILCVAIVNGITFLISFSRFSLFTYRNATDFCMLILYPATLRSEERRVGKECRSR